VITDDPEGQPADPFADLDAYAGLPRLAGLRMSPDGRRLVVGVATPDATENRYRTALWELDPQGARPARRITRSGKGESVAAFTPTGDLLFTSARPNPDSTPDAADSAPPTALWLQPATGGDARVVADPAGGLAQVVVSRHGTVVLGAALLPSAADLAQDAELRAARRKAGVSAILHEQYPIRFWDHDLGPDRTRLCTAELTEDILAGAAALELRDLTGHVGRALDDESVWDVTPDGRTVVAGWAVAEPGGSQRHTVVAVDVRTGDRRALADDPEHEYGAPVVSPDGTRVAVEVRRRGTPEEPDNRWLAVLDLTDGAVRATTKDWDRWPHSARWTPDGAALIVAADDHGRGPLWWVDAGTGQATRLTDDNGSYSDVEVSPDAQWVYALRSAVDSPPAVVRVALDGTGAVLPLRGPAEALGLDVRLPGRLTEVTATAADGGAELRAWLALPHSAGEESPAPLLLWVHGGPLHSWNSWSWRWNPWLAVAAGYAVLLPDPALSTGYGLEFIRRGWGAWGGAPYTDLMTITDATEQRADIDAEHTAAMGGSFGGYMANWIAGHTDRFDAIVTHASLWAMDQAMSTSDASYEFMRELSPEQLEDNSPHRHADAISTPMLVIHGDKDYRVPVGEALRLWWDLSARIKSADGAGPHKFLFFPDENHWVLTPNHAKLWYGTVLAFLAHHLRDEPWQPPELLG
jgi:dipeptidyl aminopeptidase/acylaminoacyl peptidase